MNTTELHAVETLYVIPADVALPGVTHYPDCCMAGEGPNDDCTLNRADHIKDTRDAINKYNFPKVGTHLRTVANAYAKGELAQDCWVLGYSKSCFAKTDTDYTVYIAFNTRHPGGYYHSNGYSISKLMLDGKPLASAVTLSYKRLEGKCKYCNRITDQSNLNTNFGACNRARCVLQAMRDNI